MNIPKALNYLKATFTLKSVSSTWKTKSIGTTAPDFLNTAAEIDTVLDAYSLKEQCLCHIEEIMGRVRVADKNAPRTIDIDIVIFNGEVLELEIFTMEHLALPLSDLLPELQDPYTGQTLSGITSKLLVTSKAKKLGTLHPD
jgi:2-amino-4-hydroxy-6-hydroxymethyldihydropteridine diphosphokinase